MMNIKTMSCPEKTVNAITKQSYALQSDTHNLLEPQGRVIMMLEKLLSLQEDGLIHKKENL
jgi:hypothetical protein